MEKGKVSEKEKAKAKANAMGKIPTKAKEKAMAKTTRSKGSLIKVLKDTVEKANDGQVIAVLHGEYERAQPQGMTMACNKNGKAKAKEKAKSTEEHPLWLSKTETNV